MAKNRKGRDLTGIFLLNKDKSMSSNYALQKVKRIFNAKKAGHTGSLDPLATGVLPICLGEATKFSSFFLNADKKYHVKLILGVETDTYDAEGQIVAESSTKNISKSSIEGALKKFRGNDNNSEIVALRLDMSDAGTAIFNNDITVTGTARVGNLNVDSADIIKIARDNLSTGQAGLTYDSAGGQFGLNANHVMALIQTVDSNGSGLNAATLDGQEGTHYRINVYDNSGTLLN